MKTVHILTGVLIVLLVSCRDRGAVSGSQGGPVCISGTGRKASCVYLSSDQHDDPVISWCEKDNMGKKYFYFSFFDEKKNSFPGRVPVPLEQHAALHEEGMPKIAIKGDGTVMAIYETEEPTKDNEWAGFVHYILSSDNGQHWSAPLCVHADTSAGKSRSFADLTRLSDGEIGVSWLDVSSDYKKGGRPVKFAKTTGAGGFTGEKMVDAVACECCRTAISSSADGGISIVYRDILQDSIRDMSVSSSSDNGATFTPAVSFSKDGWVMNGCPHNGPSAIDAGKNIYAAWRTGSSPSGLYYGELNDRHQLTEKKYISAGGRNIQLCLLPGGERILAYSDQVQRSDSFYSRIMVNKIEGDKIWEAAVTSPEGHAGYPVVRATRGNKVVIAWTENNGVYYRLLKTEDISDMVQKPAGGPTSPGISLPVSSLMMKRDPACGMPLGASVSDTVHYRNTVYGFCSPACKEMFVRDPASYVSLK